MSKRANRVGLANSQVDVYGRIKLSKKQLTKIIASLPRWTDFKVFKNGTEQILPVNTSEPNTSPIIADIDYPDGRRNNQSFLYRESPTTKDGRAWIRKIKGNTVSFNQLVSSDAETLTLINGHKFYTVVSGTKSLVDGTGQTISVTGGVDMAMDLTLMGIDNLTTTAEVEEWLSSHIGNLPYYDYTPGTLIPFMGTELKTTGKNLIDVPNVLLNANGQLLPENYRKELYPGTYTISFNCSNAGSDRAFQLTIQDLNNNNIVTPASILLTGRNHITFSLDVSYQRFKVFLYTNNNIAAEYSDIQLEIGSTPTAYEPYTENILSLPTLDYFPTGMKSVEEVYDEIDPESNKVITRVGSVDLGTLTWTQLNPSSSLWLCNQLTDIKYVSTNQELGNGISDKYAMHIGSGMNNAVGCIAIDTAQISVNTGDVSVQPSGWFLYEKAIPTEEPIIELD